MDKILLESPCLPVRLYGSFLCVLYHMVQKDFTRGLASASVLTFLLRLHCFPPHAFVWLLPTYLRELLSCHLLLEAFLDSLKAGQVPFSTPIAPLVTQHLLSIKL